MSWGGLPWWFYELDHEENEARMLGCLYGEWHPRWARCLPKHLQRIWDLG